MAEKSTAIRSPACSHFGKCGGCSFLDREYTSELLQKRAALTAALSKALPEGVEVEPVIPAAEPEGTRTSLKVPFARPAKKVLAGFFARGSHRIVNLEQCVVQDPRLVRLLLRARTLCDELRIPIYQEQWHKGLLRHLVARVAMGTDEMLAGFVVRRSGAPQLRTLARALLDSCKGDGLVGVVEIRQPEAGSRVMGDQEERLAGRPVLRETCEGLEFTSGLLSFAQVNNQQARVLYRTIVEVLGPLEGRTAADLYAGSGPIALRLAQAGAQVVAVERNIHAVREGRANARRNDLKERLSFHVADAARSLPKLLERGLSIVVVDPPRRGLPDPMVKALSEKTVPTLLYVSCDHGTLARDLERLGEAYDVRRLIPVDLFPRTEHVETIALLSARAPS